MNDSELAVVRGSNIGFVFQSFNLIPRLSALENVMLPLWFQGVPKAERIERARKILNEVGLGDRLGHKPGELSGGQKQRVAIARALAVDPDIIVADEPTGNLDSASGATILELIDRLNIDKGKTILIVTHERYVAERAQKIIHIKDGKIEKTEITSKGKKDDKIRRDYK
jgi:putative ABC transport system ATP-binding protein